MQQFAAREIGQRIAQARLEAGGMTQESLAETLNVSVRSLQDYEAGKTIPWKHFQTLTKLFDRKLEWFVHGQPEEEPTPAAAVGQGEMERFQHLANEILAAAATIAAETKRLADLLERQDDPQAPGEQQ